MSPHGREHLQAERPTTGTSREGGQGIPAPATAPYSHEPSCRGEWPSTDFSCSQLGVEVTGSFIFRSRMQVSGGSMTLNPLKLIIKVIHLENLGL